MAGTKPGHDEHHRFDPVGSGMSAPNPNCAQSRGQPPVLLRSADFMTLELIKAAILGIVEGLTEYLPVSSTGHLLLVGHLLGFSDDDFGKTFSVLIQFGAILALLSIYFVRLLMIARGLVDDPIARRFVLGVLIAFLPAAVVGVAFHRIITSVLFNPWIVCVTLIIGGGVLIWVDRLDLKPHHHDAQRFTLPMYLGIGVCQCISMIPGVSRSGATIVSAMLLGADRRSAAEFSFYLAMPTMAGAFVYDLYKNAGALTASNTLIIAVGFVTSFVAGWIVVKTFLGYVSRHGFGLFAWWRIIVGAAALAALVMGK
jgi:undecaprenyl-diphosphatase